MRPPTSFLPLAHAFALTAQLASYDQGTAIVYYGGDTRQILPELIDTKPTYLPSVPRIFEKLYTAALKMTEAGSEEERERFTQAVKIGVEVRRRRDRGEAIPEEMQHAFDRAEEALYARVRGCSAATSTRRSPARRRSRPRSSSSSTPAASRCSRAGA